MATNVMRKWFLQDEATSAEQPGSTAGGGETPAAGLDTNWDSLDQEYDKLEAATDTSDTLTESVAAEPPAATPAPTEPVPAAAATPAPTAPVPVAPTPVAATPAEPVSAQPVQPAPPAAPVPTREQLRTQYGERLAAQYALSEDDARAMLTEPELVIPKLAARLHMDVVDTVINAVFSRLPDIVGSVQSQKTANAEAEDEFFKAWPQLKDPKYQSVVWNAVASYRGLNPQAKRAEVVRAAGLSAMLHLRLPLPASLMQFESPAAPVARPFTPAAPGAGTMPAGPSGPINPFVAMSEELLADDRGG